ncbi:MAG: MgtC/SapB family protein [Stenotrophomonas sp.]
MKHYGLAGDELLSVTGKDTGGALISLAPPWSEIVGYVTALAIGLLVGLEREQANTRHARPIPAGIRTFSLLALAGALGNLVMLSASIFVTISMALSYQLSARRDPGLTSEMAMLATFLLGAVALNAPAMAGGLGVITAWLLQSKGRLHDLATRTLSNQDVRDLIYLGAAAFVILPLLPDRTLDPWGTLNPHQLWMLAVAMMAVSAVGYFSLRRLGARKGLAVAGLAGGFASSTAVVVAMAEQAKETPGIASAAASAALLSNLGTVMLMSVIIGTFSLPLLTHLAWPLASAGVAVLLAALVCHHFSGHFLQPARNAASKGRAFDPLRAFSFVGLIAGIMLIACWMNSLLGAERSVWILGLSGVADVHAATAAAARMAASSSLSFVQAEQGIVAAFCGNTLLKCILASSNGGTRFAIRVVPGALLMMGAFSVAAIYI